MKKPNILLAIIVLISFACTNDTTEGGHRHGGEGLHTHNTDSGYADQEEFITSTDTDENTKNTENSVALISEQENEVTVIIRAKKGIEYKFYMKQYEKLHYEWISEIPLYFDFHGEPLDYDVTKYFESYTEGTSDKMKGILTTPFEGLHGWYWKNTTDKDVHVVLTSKGNYSVIGLKK